MVTKIKKNAERFYICEICKLKYKDKKWAEKCREWCEKNNSCNLAITKHATK